MGAGQVCCIRAKKHIFNRNVTSGTIIIYIMMDHDNLINWITNKPYRKETQLLMRFMNHWCPFPTPPPRMCIQRGWIRIMQFMQIVLLRIPLVQLMLSWQWQRYVEVFSFQQGEFCRRLCLPTYLHCYSSLDALTTSWLKKGLYFRGIFTKESN